MHHVCPPIFTQSDDTTELSIVPRSRRKATRREEYSADDDKFRAYTNALRKKTTVPKVTTTIICTNITERTRRRAKGSFHNCNSPLFSADQAQFSDSLGQSHPPNLSCNT